MTQENGGATVKRGPAPRPGREKAGAVAGNVRQQGEDPLTDDPERGETSDADPCTAHDRAS